VISAEANPLTMAVVGPAFGAASRQVEGALTSRHQAGEVRFFWYEEAAFERRIGRWIGRLLRVLSQVLPLAQSTRREIERLVFRVRFDRLAAVRSIRTWLDDVGKVDHLLLIKPCFLVARDLQEIREKASAHVSIVLWDALWRTPTSHLFHLLM
jgi:hypothetical protein